MKALRRFVAFVDGLNDRVGNAVLYLVPLMMVIMTYEVVARYVFLKPTIWALETNQFIFLICIVLAGGFALRHGRHVSVDIIHGRLKARTRAVLNLVTVPLLLVFVGILARLTVVAAIDSLRYMEKAPGYWAPPLFPVYALMVAGVLLIFLQGIAEWVRSLMIAITGIAEDNSVKAETK